MTARKPNSTAILATAFGYLLFEVESQARADDIVDTKTARELAILSRILEKRLVHMRMALARASAARPACAAPAAGGVAETTCSRPRYS